MSNSSEVDTINPTGQPAHYVWEVPDYPKVDRTDGIKRCYVTEIRINNFKSYHGEHVVPLTVPVNPIISQSSGVGQSDDNTEEEERVPLALTGVIGPNGSGKSNLLDAVCFCLCVGAKRLRNDRLKSLVNSNHVMESKGGRCTATASLIVKMEEEDDNIGGIRTVDTTFTRSVTTNTNQQQEGDDDADGGGGLVASSTYRVNGRVCTQAEYKEELLRHHLDADAPFFMVLQGQIDKLLSKDDAMSITKAIESASGSWRYRKDYDIVLRKKDNAEENVNRLIGKRKQINQELHALTAQVQEADRYKGKKDELNKKQVDKLTYSLYEIEKEVDGLLESSEGLLEEYEDIKASLHQAKIRQANAGNEKKNINQEYQRLEKKLDKMRKKKDKVEVTLAELRGKRKQLVNSEGKMNNNINITNGKVEALEANINVIATKMEEVDTALNEVNTRRSKVDKEGGILTNDIIKECEIMNEKAEEVAASIECSIKVCKEQKALLSQSIEDNKTNIRRLEETKQARQHDLEDVNDKLGNFQRQLNDREVTLDEERRQYKERVDARIAVVKELEETKSERKRIADEVSSMRATNREYERTAKLRANVEELIRETTARRDRSQRLLDGDGNDGMIIGLVSDLIHPSNKKYTSAIKAAIGRQHLEAVVVGNKDDAIRCIKWLKEKKIPPMTFLPLQDMELPGLLLNKDDIPVNSGLHRALDCIKSVNNHIPSHLEVSHISNNTIIQQIQKLHEWLLDKTVIADTLSQARSVLYRSGRRKSPVMLSGIKAVTLDGDKIAKNGNMSNGQGGGRLRDGDIWDTQKEIATLEDKLKQKDNDISQLEGRLELEFGDLIMRGDDVNVAAVDPQTEMLKSEIAGLQDEKELIEKEINRIINMIEASRSSLDVMNIQYEEAIQRLKELEEDLKDRTRSFFEDINKRVFGEDNVDDDKHDVMSLIRQRNEVLDEMERDEHLLQQKKVILHGEHQAFEGDLERLKETLSGYESLIEEIREAIGELDKEEGELMSQMDEGETIKELEEDVAKAAAKKDELTRECYEANEVLKERLDRCNATKTAVSKEEHRLQQLRYHHMQLVRSLLSRQRGQQDILNTQEEELQRLPFENAVDVLPDLKRILFEEDDDKDEGTQDTLDKYDALELRVDEGLIGRILSEASSRRGARAGAKEVIAVLDAEIERLQESLSHLKPNLRAYQRHEEMTLVLNEAVRSLESARLEATETGQHFEALKNARKTRFNECYHFVRESVMSHYRELTLRSSSDGSHISDDGPFTPDAKAIGGRQRQRGQQQQQQVNQTNGSVYLDAENVDEPYLGVIQFSAHPESDRFVDSNLLSGGEKTIAATALLFALFAWQRPALILLDEVDAALDRRNLSTLCRFVQKRTSRCGAVADLLQILLVSLKESFYSTTQALIGVYKDPTADASHLLSLDLRPYKQGNTIDKPHSERSFATSVGAFGG